MHTNLIYLPFLVLMIIALCCLCVEYTHYKQHVYVERFVKKMFLKNMRARIISRIHKTNPKYRQCHRLIGVGYILGHGVFFGKNFFGFIEKTLPDTITTDFEFVHPPEIHELMTRTIDVLSRQKFDLKLDPKNDNSIIVSYARLGSRCVVRVRLIKLSDKLSCGQYRLISTWVQETLLW